MPESLEKGRHKVELSVSGCLGLLPHLTSGEHAVHFEVLCHPVIR